VLDARHPDGPGPGLTVLDAFWSGVGEELARHWVARVLTPAFAFWVGGLALVW